MVKMENKPFSFICSRGTRIPHLCTRSEGARLMTVVVPVEQNSAPLIKRRGAEFCSTGTTTVINLAPSDLVQRCGIRVPREQINENGLFSIFTISLLTPHRQRLAVCTGRSPCSQTSS